MLAAVGKQTVKTHYGKLEACLEKWGTPFFSGTKPAGSDFHAFEMMDQHEGMVRFPLLWGREARIALVSSIHREDLHECRWPRRNHLHTSFS